ncbi:hypothetical protein GCM10007161_00840 [Ignatzschineria indica]|uniref:Uncharacterized protein n=1 Tax=Ignatzschineria indica TaxID=472583 RepID=A0A2U2ALR8_9GAMM|nr:MULTISPECIES: hypothetical protein [Ignatzschineria]OYQ78107.1 hypothetical protein B9T19_08555 [Ignatzschineria sp. F8392]PWD84108.1 hypothetical protein DC082_00745 [Ignatzschineria indica]GGZ73915.1 hypothetical protein GCM10007161_00840 [Ignatzschineria indica]
MKKNELNPWDDHIVPRKKLDEKRVAKSKLRNVQAEIGQLSRKRSDLNPYQVLTIYLKRSLQLTYIEPWFQAFLPPRLKGKLFISTIGKRYWVIGTTRPEYRMAFTFYQKEIHNSLENHLNKISKKRWKIPGFKIAVMPENPYDKLYQKELEALMSIKSVPMKSKEEKAAFRKKRQEEQAAKAEAEEKRRSAASRIIGTISEELDQYQSRRGRMELLATGSQELS